MKLSLSPPRPWMNCFLSCTSRACSLYANKDMLKGMVVKRESSLSTRIPLIWKLIWNLAHCSAPSGQSHMKRVCFVFMDADDLVATGLDCFPWELTEMGSLSHFFDCFSSLAEALGVLISSNLCAHAWLHPTQFSPSRVASLTWCGSTTACYCDIFSWCWMALYFNFCTTHLVCLFYLIDCCSTILPLVKWCMMPCTSPIFPNFSHTLMSFTPFQTFTSTEPYCCAMCMHWIHIIYQT